MTKSNYLAVVLVLASKDPLYDKFRYYWSLFDSIEPAFKVHYVYGDSNECPQLGDLVYDIPETYWPGMITKSLEAMEYVEANYNYKYLVRTNLSTFWDFSQLLKRMYSLLDTKVVVGSLRSSYCNKVSQTYLSGTNQIYSRDLVQEILNAKSSLIARENMPEDLVISEYCLNTLGIQRSTSGAVKVLETYTKLDEKLINDLLISKKLGVDNYRVKNKNRALDIEVFRLLLKMIYNIQVNHENSN